MIKHKTAGSSTFALIASGAKPKSLSDRVAEQVKLKHKAEKTEALQESAAAPEPAPPGDDILGFDHRFRVLLTNQHLRTNTALVITASIGTSVRLLPPTHDWKYLNP